MDKEQLNLNLCDSIHYQVSPNKVICRDVIEAQMYH